MALRHTILRVKVRVLAAFAIPGAGLAFAANTATVQTAAPQDVLLVLGGFVVVVAGALALAFVRWLSRVERNVPRDPDRMATELRYIRESIQSIDRRVARIEGNLGSLTVMEDHPRAR